MGLDFYHVFAHGHKIGPESRYYHFRSDLDAVLKVSDVILTDSLPDQFRTQEYVRDYQITLERMELTRGQAMLNPCPPFVRNEEVSDDAISSDYFVGYAFKKNLVFVQQAIVLYCCGKGIG
jgi:ornithine carbamoyltransferase